jgi:ubiquitin-like 1-activating enzyme E1 B
LDRLSTRLRTLQESAADNSQAVLTFDKDDVDTLDFVTASANLRAKIFEIEMKSKFDTKRTPNYSEVPR